MIEDVRVVTLILPRLTSVCKLHFPPPLLLDQSEHSLGSGEADIDQQRKVFSGFCDVKLKIF